MYSKLKCMYTNDVFFASSYQQNVESKIIWSGQK